MTHLDIYKTHLAFRKGKHKSRELVNFEYALSENLKTLTEDIKTGKYKTTQLEEAEKFIKTLNKNDEYLDHGGLAESDALSCMLDDVFAGKAKNALFLGKGWARSFIGRRSVCGDSYVGDFYSGGDGAWLDGCRGDAGSREGLCFLAWRKRESVS